MRTLQEIQPGQTLGRYEFLVPIAEGGMASVWAARLKGSRGFSKTVAIKTMLPSVSDDPQFEQMFLDEAQIASRIRHPNVVEILDLGEEHEVLYLVMEWVDGEPLANVRRSAAKHGGIPRPIAVRLVADASAGLHAAHELKDEAGQPVGLVHRDMSPQNVLITFDGVVKIVDFGVAKAAGRSSQQTSAGQVKGKPPYMSPEQALGDHVDRRTDVFALGIILYQLTTGKHPFRGESDLVTLQNIVSDKPVVPPRAYDKQFPKMLNAAIMKALDRDPAKRFDNCADFEACLDEVFVKEVARARNEDVGKFVTDMLGAKGEERRKALKDAIARADEREVARNSLADLSRPTGAEPFRVTPTSNPSAVPVQMSIGPSGSVTSQATDDPSGLNVAPGTGFGSSVSAPGQRRRRATGWAAVVGTLAIAGGVGFAAVHSGKSEGPATPARPAAAEVPVSDRVAEPLVEQPKVEPPASELEELATPPAGPSAAPSAHAVTYRVNTRPSSSKSSKRTDSKKKPPSGFVPPPVTDPGF